MGHAGAIITGVAGRADEKVKALRGAGCEIISTPADIGEVGLELFGAGGVG